MGFSEVDYRFMNQAIQLAWQGVNTTHPNPRVGCVIARDAELLGAGLHEWAGQPHAEINALNHAGEAAKGATAYVTLEPCAHQGRTPPCCDALIKAGVARVVVAMRDPYPQVAGRGIARMEQAGIRVELGLCEDQAEALNQGFLSRVRKKRPWVRVKLAASIDGRTGLANGISQWITGPDARADVQYLRARASALLTGIGTVLADNPSLNVRIADSDRPVRQPVRIVLDRHYRMPLNSKLLSLPGPVWWVGSEQTSTPDCKGFPELTAMSVNESSQGLDLKQLMGKLAAFEINELHVEAGEKLSGSLLRAGLVDELILYLAPCALGASAKGLFSMGVLESMSERINFKWHEMRRVGEDLKLVLRAQ